MYQNDSINADMELEQLSERVAQLEEENNRLDQALRRNSRVFEELLLNGDQGVTLTGPDRRIVRVIRGVTGFDPASLVGRPIESLVIEEDRQVIIDAYAKLLDRTCPRIRILVRIRHADGSVVLYAGTLTDMLENPDIQGIVCNYATYPFLERL